MSTTSCHPKCTINGRRRYTANRTTSQGSRPAQQCTHENAPAQKIATLFLSCQLAGDCPAQAANSHAAHETQRGRAGHGLPSQKSCAAPVKKCPDHTNGRKHGDADYRHHAPKARSSGIAQRNRVSQTEDIRIPGANDEGACDDRVWADELANQRVIPPDTLAHQARLIRPNKEHGDNRDGAGRRSTGRRPTNAKRRLPHARGQFSSRICDEVHAPDSIGMNEPQHTTHIGRHALPTEGDPRDGCRGLDFDTVERSEVGLPTT